MAELSPDLDQRYLEALKALIATGVYAAPLESSPLIELPVVAKRAGPHATPAERASRFIEILESAVRDRLRMNDRQAAEMLFALEKWTGIPAHGRRDAVAKLRDKHWTWDANYRKEPLLLDLNKVYLAIMREGGHGPTANHVPVASDIPVIETVLGSPTWNYEKLNITIRRLCSWVRQVQNKDGGFPSDNEGSLSCTWGTAGLLWAMAEAGENPGELWKRRALAWVLDRGNPDRGIPAVGYGAHQGDLSITDATAQTLLAVNACYRSTGDEFYREKLMELVNWLLLHQELGAGWAWRPGVESSWMASTCFALIALQEAMKSASQQEEIDEAIRTARRWLIETRNSDSGWGSCKGDRSRPALTGLVIYTICRLEKVRQYGISSEFLGSTLDFIKSEFKSQGRWLSSIDRPMGHTVTRFGDAYCLLGLISGSEEGDPFIDRGINALMQSYIDPHFQHEETIMHTWPTRDGILALSAVREKLSI